MTAREWLASLKVGSEVYVTTRGHYGAGEITRIDRVTPAGWLQVKLYGQTVTFNPDGTERTSSWGRRNLRPVTQDRRDEVERARLLSRLSLVKWERQPLETLRTVAEAVGVTE